VLQDGWKAIYKASILMLRDNDERLRASCFEMVLSQLPLLPQKFMFGEAETPENVKKFEDDWNSVKISDQVFERVTYEFEDSIL
jgi:hypothetical protein